MSRHRSVRKYSFYDEYDDPIQGQEEEDIDPELSE